MSEARRSTPGHWESYWRGHADIETTYSTGGRLIREVLVDGPVAGKRVMEVGAGSGRDLLGLAQRGAIGVVLDYSPGSLAIVSRLAREQGIAVHLVQADALAMPFRDGTFEVVFHQGLLEHFRDPMPLMRENARVTAPGGRVVVDVPQTFHLYTVMKQTLIAFDRWFAGWERQFSPGELEAVCVRAGLRVKRTYGDWMVPGLFYRVLRELLKRGRIARLPLEPEVPLLSPLFRRVRDAIREQRWALYTCHVIGTVAEKP